MADEKKHDNANTDFEGQIPDEQLKDASGGIAKRVDAATPLIAKALPEKAHLSDEQLEEASGGLKSPGPTKYSNITLRKGYVDSGELRLTQGAQLQELDEIKPDE